MGVPKFFRYISERYPCLSEVVREYQIPEFDNLYLDMNGIIHNCSHPNDFDPHFRISEEDIFKDIFSYIETLFRMIQPKKLFFLAVDGVAPRAKMNQQRGRRFKSAREAETLEKNALSKGEKLPDVERFDSNCITPGTAFMARLQAELKHFITYKINTDNIWRKPTVILSGHETPGEGEHKIMDYIRFMKSKPDYDGNTRHCLYGLDADLIMLGLCTHEPHFSLLREEVVFNKKAQKKRSNSADDIKFYLLHLSLMREYIELEFQDLKTSLPFDFDLEKIIDDWVLMGFLVGNDFIPHLPHLHINKGALPILYKAYMDVMPTLDGYINEDGTLNLIRFQKYMEKLSSFDYNQFKDLFTDLKYFEGKTGRKANRNEEINLGNDGNITSGKMNPELAALIKGTEELLGDEDNDYSDSSDEEYENSSMLKAEFHQHKNDYYKTKLDYTEVTQHVLQSQAECYVRAIQWNLNYYYNGCCSWSWYYPHHYAPYMSDIRNFADFELNFDMGEPFLPFQQLLAVLPAGSKKLLPEPYQALMVDEDSPILDFYPTDFETDLNGKRQHWEAVVLIPFIDEKKLLKAMEPCYDRLTDEEKRRNCHGPMEMFNYTDEDLGFCELPESFPHIENNHVLVTSVHREDIFVERSELTRGLCKSVNLEVYFPGFPTLKHLNFEGKLEKAKVMVFEQPSLGDNMILTVAPKKHMSLEKYASRLLDKVVHVSWPHLREARVKAISDGEMKYSLSNVSNEKKEIVNEKIENMKHEHWKAETKTIALDYKRKLGVDVGETKILIYATFLEGKKIMYLPSGKVTLKKQWSPVPTPFALQTAVEKLQVHEDAKGKELTLPEVFKPGAYCFLLAAKFYGDMGLIHDGQYDGKIKLTINHFPEPDFRQAKSASQKLRSLYVTGKVLANRVGLSSHLLSRITGSIFISKDDSEQAKSVNVGLNLKFNKRNEEVSGYTKKTPDGIWLYSPKAEKLLTDYMKVAGDLLKNISSCVGSDSFVLKDILPVDGEERLTAITNWLKEQELSKCERQTCGSEVLDEEVLNIVERIVDKCDKKPVKTFTIQCKPNLLVLPVVSLGSLSPDQGAEHRLFDRVRSIRESYIVPLGTKGTIVGIHKAEKPIDVGYDILYDEQFPGGQSLKGSDKRCARAFRQAFINLSYGERLAEAKELQSNQYQESSFGRVRDGRNSSAFVSCQENQDEEEDSPFFKSLQIKKKPNSRDPPSDHLKRILKISDGAEQNQNSSVDTPRNMFESLFAPLPLNPTDSIGPYFMELYNLTSKLNRKLEITYSENQSGNFTAVVEVSSKKYAEMQGLSEHEAKESACHVTLEALKNERRSKSLMNCFFPQPLNHSSQRNSNRQSVPPLFPAGPQMMPQQASFTHRLQQRRDPNVSSMYPIPTPPQQWFMQNQTYYQPGSRGAGRGSFQGHYMNNARDNTAVQQLDKQLERIQMQPSRRQREAANQSYRTEQNHSQYLTSQQPFDWRQAQAMAMNTQIPQYQFSQSWSDKRYNESEPLNYDNSRTNYSRQRGSDYSTPNHPHQQPYRTPQNQFNPMGMPKPNNGPVMHPQSTTSRPQSVNQPKWKIACNFAKPPVMK